MSDPRKPEPGIRKQGRPALPAEDQTRPRSIRLNDARWAKLQRLGREWLEKELDAADELEVVGKTKETRHGAPDD